MAVGAQARVWGTPARGPVCRGDAIKCSGTCFLGWSQRSNRQSVQVRAVCRARGESPIKRGVPGHGQHGGASP